MIESKSLIFEEYNESLISGAFKNCLSSYETAKYTLWKPTSSEKETKEKLEYWTSDFKAKDVFWMIREKTSQEVIGFITASQISPNVFGSVGIAIGERFTGQGYGSEALSKLIEYVKMQGGKELHYSHFKENIASKNLALKFGFVYYKQEKRLRRYDNKLFDELFYVLKII